MMFKDPRVMALLALTLLQLAHSLPQKQVKLEDIEQDNLRSEKNKESLTTQQTSSFSYLKPAKQVITKSAHTQVVPDLTPPPLPQALHQYQQPQVYIQPQQPQQQHQQIQYYYQPQVVHQRPVQQHVYTRPQQIQYYVQPQQQYQQVYTHQAHQTHQAHHHQQPQQQYIYVQAEVPTHTQAHIPARAPSHTQVHVPTHTQAYIPSHTQAYIPSHPPQTYVQPQSQAVSHHRQAQQYIYVDPRVLAQVQAQLQSHVYAAPQHHQHQQQYYIQQQPAVQQTYVHQSPQPTYVHQPVQQTYVHQPVQQTYVHQPIHQQTYDALSHQFHKQPQSLLESYIPSSVILAASQRDGKQHTYDTIAYSTDLFPGKTHHKRKSES